jgi:hypothetical protein
VEADERANEKQQILRALRRVVALTPAAAVLGVLLLVSIDLAGTMPVATLALGLALLVTAAGPALLPFASAGGHVAIEPLASIELAIDEWSRRGALSWLAHGLALGALLAAPVVLLVVPGLCLGWPVGLGVAAWLARFLMTHSGAREPSTARARPVALAPVVLATILGPLLAAMLVPAPMWLVDRRPFDRDEAPRAEPSIPEVYLEDAPFFVIGVNVVRGSETELVRAPLGIFSSVAREPGRARLLWSDEEGGYYVPFTAEGARADDGPLDRVRARLDLGGALPIAATCVAVALAALAWAVMRGAGRGARAVALLAALAAHAAIAWAY